MIKMKKFIAVLLVLMTVSGLLIACGDNETQGQGKTDRIDQISSDRGTEDAETTAEESDPTGIPETLTFEGRTFAFLTSPRTGDAYCELFLDSDEKVSDDLNEAIYNRNMMVEERFDISLAVEHSVNYWNATQKITESNLSGEHRWDAVYCSGSHLGTIALSGDLVDLNKLDYVNFYNDYWDSNCYDALSIGHKNFVMVSDISMSVFWGAHNTLFNKQMLADNNIEDDPYQLVRDGEWTFDKMHEMIKVASWENGDGVRDEKDKYGLFNLNIPGTLISFGFSFTEKDEDDYPVVFTLTSEFQRAFEMLRDLGYNEDLQFDPVRMLSPDVDYVSTYGHVWDWTRGVMFQNDQIMFMYGGVVVTELLREMKSDYGIVPNAKLNEDQENYACQIDYYTDFLAVPNTNDDMEFTGAVLEYMAYVSTDTVRNSYIEVVLKNKRNRDGDMQEMIDIIIGSLHYEVSDIFNIGIRDFIVSASTNNTLKSTYTKYNSVYKYKLDNLKEAVKNVD